jgi:hypothetical protein
VDFYSPHFYAGHCGENADVDIAAVTGASVSILRPDVVNFPGEWGVLGVPAPYEIRRRTYRDALWLSLTADAPGFFQWTYEFLEEYRWAQRIFRALGDRFSPPPPAEDAGISEAWAAYRGAQTRANWERLLEAWRRSEARKPKGLRAVGGYQVSSLADPARRVWLAYLRSRRSAAFGKYHLAVPAPAPLRLELDLPPGRYRVTAIDLSTGRTHRYAAAGSAALDIVPLTSDDYVVVAAPREFRFRP